MKQPEAMTEGTASARVHRRPSVRTARWLAWSLWALSVVLVALSGVLLALSFSAAGGSPYWLTNIVAALALSTVGALVASRRPMNSIGWLFGASGLLYAVMVFAGEYGTYALVADAGSLPGGVVAVWLGSWLYVFAANLFLYSFLLFPDGRLPSPRWRVVAWLAALTICLDSASLALAPGPLDNFPAVENPFGFERAAGLLSFVETLSIPFLVATLLAPVAALFVRFRRARGEERQQIKWVAFAATILPAAIVAVTVWPDLDPTVAGRALFLIAFLAIPAAIGIAILKHRLYDIDLIINRTLVFGALTASVVVLYVLVVGYLGAIFRVEDNLLVSLTATALVAVIFAPLRERLQKAVNRLMYGERNDPYAVLSRLGHRVEATFAPDAVLPAIVETVAQALKLPYAAVTLKQKEGFQITAEHGTPAGEPVVLPLVYGSETVGQLVLAPRAPNEAFTKSDLRLLEDLARQVGVAVHAVRLTADLQRSRERLVTAREEERRRLRRDLHDGVGPQLAALMLKLETARSKLAHDPAADPLLVDLAERIRDVVADVRRAVYDLRPPALDELGLVPALREGAEQYGHNGLRISVDVPEDGLPPLPAAVEVAVYRISQEAMTNVARHAEARNCAVRIALNEPAGTLRLEVSDDGRGLEGAVEKAKGVGLASMRERAEELGGTFAVESTPAGGARVSAWLPYSSSDGTHDPEE